MTLKTKPSVVHGVVGLDELRKDANVCLGIYFRALQEHGRKTGCHAEAIKAARRMQRIGAEFLAHINGAEWAAEETYRLADDIVAEAMGGGK